MFVDYPISNYDILEWVKYLKIKNFKDVFSRDNLKGTIKKPECGIINLDDKIGFGTHWVCYYNNYYFDPFGMPPATEVVKYISNIQYNNIHYQDTKSVLCGYYCLYFLKSLNDGIKIYDILYEKLNCKDPSKNEIIIKDFFK